MAKKTRSRIPYKDDKIQKILSLTDERKEDIPRVHPEKLPLNSLPCKIIKDNISYPYRSDRQHESHSDEITLRDEILKLKQEMMILKRTNEQYLVKLRKYEDEVKRKDKHLEQLMDPRKNSDITKVLSSKGAAILMNLKDQNNSLIQMILNKDLHIRRLVAQIKMSKLYASTRKNENYRAEITRLRNLLIKSQESLKENVDVKQQTRSIYVNGNSLLEFSSSSDQSSPRDLDELRLTILNLESHIKYSNDMLAEKNQKISLLTDELNFLRKFFHSKTSKNKAFVSDFMDAKNHKFSTADFTSTWPNHTVSTKIPGQDISDLFEKNTNHESDNLPHSAPAAFPKWFSSVDSTPKYSFQSQILEQRLENKTEPEDNLNQENCKEIERSSSLLKKSLFHNLATDEIKKKETVLSNSKKEIRPREKWKEALIKYRELKQLNPKTFGDNEKNENTFTEKKNNPPKNSPVGKAESENQSYQILEEKQMNLEDFPKNAESPKSFIGGANENRSRIPTSVLDNVISGNETCQSSEKNSSVFYKDEEKWTPKAEKDEEPQIFSDNEKKFSEAFERKIKSHPEIYRQSSDSSFDSENDYSIKQMQVEVQINSVSPHNGSDQSEKSFSENNLISEYSKENGENDASDPDFNDDDDVIVREK